MSKSFLLDTHCLIWFQENNPNLSSRVLELIKDAGNTIYFSQVSLFEIAIKQKIGKLPHFMSNINEIYYQAVKDNFTFLSIQNKHLLSYNNVPLFNDHRDPFDRLLIATACEENAIMLTADKNFELYHHLVEVLW